MDEHIATLEKDYCPPLDAAIVYAIYSDFSGQPDALESTRQLLEPLKESALNEQYTDFDPSGSSGQPGLGLGHSSSELSGDSTSKDTDLTSLSTGLSSLALGSNGSGHSSPDGHDEYMDYFQNLSNSAKETQLIETFPTLKPITISHILKKCKGNYSRATDELLNHALFEELDVIEGEERVSRKGVDSFAVNDAAPRGRKSKGKNRGNKYMSIAEYSRSSSEPAVPSTNKWKTTTEDIRFISSRTNISSQTVSSTYHKNGGSVSATIMALIELDMQTNKDAKADDEIIQQNSIDLTTEFPSIDLAHAFSLIRMTHPSSSAAHELAKAITSETRTRPTGGLQIIPKYAPIDLSSSDSTPTTPSLTPVSTAFGTTASAYSQARSAAFNQASTAHRKGKSDHLMKAAAGYYGQLGRDYNRALQAASAQEADALVDAQSTPQQLDLHGVNVKDATRIARERVTAWWAGLGEARIKSYAGPRGGIGEGFRIVTGLGRHSEGGRAKIGPAVGRMLVREGWKVEVGSGVLVVTGVARKA